MGRKNAKNVTRASRNKSMLDKHKARIVRHKRVRNSISGT